jgi:glycosyltransferase involved in cell wall biosynthesis
MVKKNNNPLVTVIIPSYNHAQYIVEAIESVKSQTYDNLELIVIDDGSTDNTHEVLKSMPKDERIVLILNKDNKRQSARMNQAIALSKGKYISIFTSDDWYLPEKLEKQVALFQTLRDEYGVVYSSGYRYYEDLDKTIEMNTQGNMRRGWILEALLTEPFFIYPISPLIKKECFSAYPFDESYTAEGEAIHLKIAMKYKYDFIDEPLVTMREHSYNIGGNIDRMLAENIRYREELFTHKDFPKELLKYRSEILGKIYKLKGWEYIRLKKEYSKGKKALVNAIKVNKALFFDKRVMVGLLLCLLPESIVSKINK